MHLLSCRLILSAHLLYSSLGDYSFQYRVNNNDDSVQYSHEEDRSKDDTSGHYQVLLPDGRTQVVTYNIPDKDTGYLALVQYQKRNRDTQRKREIIKKVYKKPPTVKQRRSDLEYKAFIRKLYGISANAHNPMNQTLHDVSGFDKEKDREMKTYDIIPANMANNINDKKAFDDSSDDNTGELFDNYKDVSLTRVGTQNDILMYNHLDKEIDTNFKTKPPNTQIEYLSSEKEEIGHHKALQEENFSIPVDSMDLDTEDTDDKTGDITVESHTSIPDTFYNTESSGFEKKPLVSVQNYENQQFDKNNVITDVEYDKSSGTSDLLTVQINDNDINDNEGAQIMGEKDTTNEQSRILDNIANNVESDTYEQTIRQQVSSTENMPAIKIYTDDIVEEVFEDNFYNKHLKDTYHVKSQDNPTFEYRNIKTSMAFPDNFQSKGRKELQNINKQVFSNSQKHGGNYKMIERERFNLKANNQQEENMGTFRKKRKVSNQAISYFKCIKTFLFNLLPFDL